MATDPRALAAPLGIDEATVRRLQVRGYLQAVSLTDVEVRERLYRAHLAAGQLFLPALSEHQTSLQRTHKSQRSAASSGSAGRPLAKRAAAARCCAAASGSYDARRHQDPRLKPAPRPSAARPQTNSDEGLPRRPPRPKEHNGMSTNISEAQPPRFPFRPMPPVVFWLAVLATAVAAFGAGAVVVGGSGSGTSEDVTFLTPPRGQAEVQPSRDTRPNTVMPMVDSLPLLRSDLDEAARAPAPHRPAPVASSAPAGTGAAPPDSKPLVDPYATGP